MIDWSYIVARLVSAIGSWIDSSNLRNKVYKQAEEAEIMMTALEDIERMSREDNIKRYARKAIETVRGLPIEDDC
jgi:5'-deoxynucleotidase YfbR-like HD superfamily hydrolase